MKVLITGANGQVGWALAQQAKKQGIGAIALDSTELDITDGKAVHAKIMTSAVQAVINGAAYTNVDKAEQEHEQAFSVNCTGPANLARACSQAQIPLLHLSTDYVFDGSQSKPYQENDPVAPLGVYGNSKWQGEQLVREHCRRHIILRTSWVFGIHGHNFVKTILRLARQQEVLKIVADQKGCPTFAGAIADCLLSLVKQIVFSSDSAWGTYHYCGTPETTWHGFASTIIDYAKRYETLAVDTVDAITTADFPTLAKRPANSVMICNKIEQNFAIHRHAWRGGLEQTLQSICN